MTSDPDPVRPTGCVAVAMTLALLAACDSIAPVRPDANALGPTGALCSPASTLSYESFGRSFFDRYCQTCHASTVQGVDRQGAPPSNTFDTAQQIREQAFEIDVRAAAGPDRVNVDMPRSLPMPTYPERLLLGGWLACGAP